MQVFEISLKVFYICKKFKEKKGYYNFPQAFLKQIQNARIPKFFLERRLFFYVLSKPLI